MALPNAHMADDPARVDVIVLTQRDVPTDGALATSSNALSRQLPSASSNNMALPDARAADAAADTDLVVSTQLDITTTSALATDIDALEHSPLGRLPRELRDRIYDMVFTQPDGLVCGSTSWKRTLEGPPVSPHDGTPVSQALNIRATCKQINAETESMFFKLNDISIDLFHLGREYQPSSREERGKQSTHFVNAIPPRLLSSTTKVIVWVPSACANSRELSRVIRRIAQSVQHGNLFLGARFGTRWFAGGDSLFPLIHVPRPDGPVLKDV
jgi:hypothetical protein